ncbi:MAG: pitrilysin family protein [Bacteroidota bacterium]
MKQYITGLVFIMLAGIAGAQTTATTFDVDGLKVIFRPTQKETVSIAMYYRGGVMNYPAEKAGVEQLALAAATTSGTKNYSVHDYKELSDEYGIDITGGSTTDYGVISMDCINKYFTQGWKLFSDAIVNPVFDPAEFAAEKDKQLATIHRIESSPEAMIEQLTFKNVFKQSRYSTLPNGDEKSLRSLNADSVKSYYYNQLLNKNRMFLVVAGKISREELTQKIKDAFSAIPSKPYTAPVYTDLVLSGDRLVANSRAMATNYISRVMNAPVLGSPDYPAFKLAITVLSSYMHYKLRTEKALSYAPGAKIKMMQVPYVSMYISTTQPTPAVQGMLDAFDAVKEAKYNPAVLKDIKRGYKLENYKDMESSTTIVDNLGKAEILGSYKLEENLLASVDNVDQADVTRVFSKYLTGSVWIYLGNEQMAKEAFK